MAMQAKRVISGTWGSVWLNGEKLPSIVRCQAKVSKQKEKVSIAGRMMVGHKTVSAEGTGSLSIHHTDSILLRDAARQLRSGLSDDNTIVSALADPEAWGAERIALYGVDFDDAVLADWEVGALGKRECPFTFEDYELLDLIEEGN